MEKGISRGNTVGRPISVSAVPPGPGIDIWRTYNSQNLSGHGLASRPGEIADPRFLSFLLGVFGYPRDCGADLLEGSLPLRYCRANFEVKKPNWDLPDVVKVLDLVTSADSEAEDSCEVLVESGGDVRSKVLRDRFGVVWSQGAFSECLFFLLRLAGGRVCVLRVLQGI